MGRWELAMGLRWRLVLSFDESSLDGFAEPVRDWVARRSRAPTDSTLIPGDQVLSSGSELAWEAALDPSGAAFRVTLTEPEPDGETLFRIVALEVPGRVHVMAECERYGTPVLDGSEDPAPALAGVLAEVAPGWIGSTPLEKRAISLDDSDTLLSLVTDSTRSCPLVVLLDDAEEAPFLSSLAGETHHRVAGMANTYLARGATASEVRGRLESEPGLASAFAGLDSSAHVLLPLGVAGSQGELHRSLTLRELNRYRPAAAGDWLARLVRPWSLTQRPPGDLLRRTRAVFESSADEELVEEILVLEELLEEQRAAAVALEAAVEVERRNADAGEREVTALKLRLAHSAPDASPATAYEAAAFTPTVCADVGPAVERYLQGLVFPRSCWGPEEELDRHSSGLWASRAWRALRSLDDYSQKKSQGDFTGNFIEYCNDGGLHAIPAAWVALHESESTTGRDDLRAARTFPVAVEASSHGRAFMPAHIKVTPGGKPAPRIHFLDDTGGQSGRVHIGYFGDHLQTSSAA